VKKPWCVVIPSWMGDPVRPTTKQSWGAYPRLLNGSPAKTRRNACFRRTGRLGLWTIDLPIDERAGEIVASVRDDRPQ
jgi:hypothetical protein